MENNLMNGTNSLTESVMENGETSIFCRKCGNKLVADMNVCDQCGTEAVKQESDIQEDEISFNNEEYEASKLSLKKKTKKASYNFCSNTICGGVNCCGFLYKQVDR